MPNNQVQIIAGKWRSRKVLFNDADGLRPTSSRIRETLFNWLAPVIADKDCVDLFAGSGALGLEALSRGAKHCHFVDNNHQSLRNIQTALSTFNCNEASVSNNNALDFLNSKDIQNIDILFIDPPYSLLTIHELVEALELNFAPDQECIMFYEHEQTVKSEGLPQHWHIQKEKKAGKVHYYLIKRKPLNSES